MGPLSQVCISLRFKWSDHGVAAQARDGGMRPVTDLDCSKDPVVQDLYRLFGRPALGKVIRMLGRREIAQEIVQDVFIRLWRSGPRFNSEKAAYAWIFKACHNASIDVLRSAVYRHEARADDVLEAPDIFSADSPLSTVEHRQLLRQAIASLSTQEAAVVMYFAFDSMNQEEIAEQMGLSRKTIGRVIARYQTRLRLHRETDHA